MRATRCARAVSVIIPTYNSEEDFEKHIRTLRELTSQNRLDVEIIVVDAGSMDDTVKVAKKYADKVVIIDGISRGRARNVGADLSKSEILVFLDSDCEITESWVAFINGQLDLSSKLVSGPAVLCKSNTLIGQAAKDLLSNPIFTLGSLTFSFEKCQKHDVREVPASNLLISKKIFTDLGGFPDLNYNEDTLFSKRVRNCGCKIVYEPSFICLHYKHFDSLGHFSKYFFKYGATYAKTVKELGHIRRYALIPLLFGLLLISLGAGIFMNLIEPVFFSVFSCVSFLVPLLYSVARNREFSSTIVPILFYVLLISYIGGFYFGIIKSRT